MFQSEVDVCGYDEVYDDYVRDDYGYDYVYVCNSGLPNRQLLSTACISYGLAAHSDSFTQRCVHFRTFLNFDGYNT